MRTLDVEFVPRRWPHRTIAVWVIGCCVVALCFAGLAWQAREEAHGLGRQNLELAQRINRLAFDDEQRRQQARKPPPAYLADAAVLAKVGSFPIQAALRALETTPLMGIKINSIDVRADSGVVELSLDFSDYKALLTYLDALNDGEPASRWKLKQATVGLGNAIGAATIAGTW